METSTKIITNNVGFIDVFMLVSFTYLTRTRYSNLQIRLCIHSMFCRNLRTHPSVVEWPNNNESSSYVSVINQIRIIVNERKVDSGSQITIVDSNR